LPVQVATESIVSRPRPAGRAGRPAGPAPWVRQTDLPARPQALAGGCGRDLWWMAEGGERQRPSQRQGRTPIERAPS